MRGPKRYKETAFQRFESETLAILCCFPAGMYRISAFHLRSAVRTDVRENQWLRSNFNSREFNSRENDMPFGHN